MRGSFLSALPEPDRAALARLTRRQVTAAGGTLFLEGDESTSFAVVLSGRVKLVGRSDAGRQVLIGMRVGGDIVGEMGALDGRPRSVDVVAVDEVTAMVGSPRALREFLAGNPAGWAAICGSLADRLREADQDRVASATLAGEARVAVRLTGLARRYGTASADGAVELPITQDELADWTGVSRPTIARALAGLRAAGLARTGRGRIVITDTDALAAYHLT